MPSPRANATFLINLFHQFNLSITDLVALSGSHSIGQARCFSMVFRLKDELFPKDGDKNVTGGVDATPVALDNQYFKDLIQKKGFLNSDQTLYSGDARTRESWLKNSAGIKQHSSRPSWKEWLRSMGDLQSDKGSRRDQEELPSGELMIGYPIQTYRMLI